MKITWLGQAGYRIKSEDGTVIMIDPYLSDTLHETEGDSHIRMTPMNPDLLNTHVDILIITHRHGDHMDHGTIGPLYAANPDITILAPASVNDELRNKYKGINCMMFNSGIEIQLRNILFTSTYAAHPDIDPIGVIIYCDGKTICHTGDTMFHKKLRDDYPVNADALFVPINGKGDNMNAADAARLTKYLKPEKVFPMHWDMFIPYKGDVNEFKNEMDNEKNIILPDVYKEFDL